MFDLNTATQSITTSIDARIAKLRDAGNEVQARKWDRERTHLVMPSTVEYLAGTGADLSKIGGLAIYVVEKVRKIARWAATGKGHMDNYSAHLLKQARVMDKKKMEFSFGLQRAALSQEVEFENAHKLGSRLKCSTGTANSQSSSSHIALGFLGLAKNVMRSTDEKADCNYTVVDFASPIVDGIVNKKAKAPEVAA